MSNWLEEINGCRDDLKRLIKQCITKADAFQVTGNREMMKFFDALSDDLSSIDCNLNKAVDNKIDTDLALAIAAVANTFRALAKGTTK